MTITSNVKGSTLGKRKKKIKKCKQKGDKYMSVNN